MRLGALLALAILAASAGAQSRPPDVFVTNGELQDLTPVIQTYLEAGEAPAGWTYLTFQVGVVEFDMLVEDAILHRDQRAAALTTLAEHVEGGGELVLATGQHGPHVDALLGHWAESLSLQPDQPLVAAITPVQRVVWESGGRTHSSILQPRLTDDMTQALRTAPPAARIPIDPDDPSTWPQVDFAPRTMLPPSLVETGEAARVAEAAWGRIAEVSMQQAELGRDASDRLKRRLLQIFEAQVGRRQFHGEADFDALDPAHRAELRGTFVRSFRAYGLASEQEAEAVWEAMTVTSIETRLQITFRVENQHGESMGSLILP